MKLIPALTLLIASGFASAALAQTPPVPSKAATAAAKPAAKPRTKAPAAKPVPPPPLLPPLLDATEDQLAATERAYLGQYDCEFKQTIHIALHPKPGYVNVSWQKEVITMKPVLSSTGALRLEDVTGRTLMIQIANKSMLMDTKLGRRLVDECLHPSQRAAIEAAKVARAAAAASAAASGVEVVEPMGLGIKPAG